MNLYFILTALSFVAMLVVGRWTNVCFYEAQRIMESKGIVSDVRFGWKELRQLDAKLYSQYLFRLIVFTVLALLSVTFLLIGLLSK
jgi:hypothetical protein